MSIYPVRVKAWFVCHRKWNEDIRKEFKIERGLIKYIIKKGTLKCLACGKKVTDWNTAYVSHAFAYGYNDAYCNKKCYLSKRKTKNLRREGE